MSLRNPVGGPSVAAWQISGLPWVTGSVAVPPNTTLELNFPMVSKFLKLSSSVGVFLAFTSNGATAGSSNRFPISPGTSDCMEIRTRQMFVRNESGVTASVSVLAGLAQVPVDDYLFLTSSLALTGSKWMVYPGVG